MCDFPSGNFPKVRLDQGLSAAAKTEWGGGERCGQNRLGKFLLGKLHILEVATWENTLGKLLLGKNPLSATLRTP